MRAEFRVAAPIRRTSLSACRSLLRTLFRNPSFVIIYSAIISDGFGWRYHLGLDPPSTEIPVPRDFEVDTGFLLVFAASDGQSHAYGLDKLNSLAVVVDSEEAKNTTKIKQLLCWLSSIGIKYIILYDMQGVLKQTIGIDLESLTNTSMTPCSVIDAKTASSLFHFGKMAIEIISLSDGKEGVAKAASFLYSEHMKDDSEICHRSEPDFTESDVANALKATGSAGDEPDLLLVYGPARCHLGFPAWRLRYTEIVHMGRLRSMNFAAILYVCQVIR
ncbi:hypothetical protein OPV22_000773 [Ensete ventricosum]|uniref:ditrans,polycis-polyprenyl diphosphate synthase [(2E,6E)-farnesyldiphosphate specific] n=1 Tax=Ensete ventricosum TaxID=4639 RepID=A0AAV8RVU2_ENSVE|nr:hypothetical protein OPV22_000773 [Ensete ventricosum]